MRSTGRDARLLWLLAYLLPVFASAWLVIDTIETLLRYGLFGLTVGERLGLLMADLCAIFLTTTFLWGVLFWLRSKLHHGGARARLVRSRLFTYLLLAGGSLLWPAYSGIKLNAWNLFYLALAVNAISGIFWLGCEWRTNRRIIRTVGPPQAEDEAVDR